MSGEQVKNSVQVYLDNVFQTSYFGNKTSKNLTLLAWGTSEDFRIVLPLPLNVE